MNISDEKAKGIMQYLRGNQEASGVTPDEVEDWLQEFQKDLGISDEDIQECFAEPDEEYLDEANACPYEDDIEGYLYLFEEASSEKQKKKYLEKALALDPDNLDVQYHLRVLEHGKSGDVLLYVEEILEKGKARLQEKGFYEAAKGRFPHFRETQPYFRTLIAYMAMAEAYGMMRKAAAAGEEILECCSNEINESNESQGNFEGAWARTLCIYADLEDSNKAMPLIEKMDEGARENAFYLLPLTFLYYKLGKWDVASQYVNALQQENKYFKKLITWYCTNKLDDAVEKVEAGLIWGNTEKGTWIELLDAYSINDAIYKANPGFFLWAKGQLGRRKK